MLHLSSSSSITCSHTPIFLSNNYNMLHSSNPTDYLLEVPSFDNDHEAIASPLFPFSPILVEYANDDPLNNFAPHDHMIKTPSLPPDPIPAAEDECASSKRCNPRNDRHSKIRTADGLRDRRVRLSVDVAGRFFALQDMLGFDKPSFTINWLLKQSSSAIERHFPHFSRLSSSPKSTDQSVTSLDTSTIIHKKAMQPSPAASESFSRRESRNEARARARRGTMEKKMKMKMLLEVEGGKIAHTTEKVVSSLTQGSNFVDESSPCIAYHQTNDYSISDGIESTVNFFEEELISRNFSVEFED